LIVAGETGLCRGRAFAARQDMSGRQARRPRDPLWTDFDRLGNQFVGAADLTCGSVSPQSPRCDAETQNRTRTIDFSAARVALVLIFAKHRGDVTSMPE